MANRDRRSKLASPRPQRTGLELTERDLAIFEAIDRHGPLPTNYLFELTRSLGKDFSAFRERITDLYHGYCDHPEHRTKGFSGCSHVCAPRTFLIRDPAQHRTFRALSQQSVYGLAPRARLLLAEQGRARHHPIPRSDPFLHQLFGACLSASFELVAHRFIAIDEILLHKKCPAATRVAANPLRVATGLADATTLIPDNLFGIEYEGGGFRFFAVEVDRNTEDIEPDPRRKVKSSIAAKVKAYAAILSVGSYRTHFGLPNLTVLFATTNVGHLRRMMEYVTTAVSEPLRGKFLFQAFPTFGADWRVPSMPLDVMSPWIGTSMSVAICGEARRGNDRHIGRPSSPIL